jgi:hypothetical protein
MLRRDGGFYGLPSWTHGTRRVRGVDAPQWRPKGAVHGRLTGELLWRRKEVGDPVVGWFITACSCTNREKVVKGSRQKPLISPALTTMAYRRHRGERGALWCSVSGEWKRMALHRVKPPGVGECLEGPTGWRLALCTVMGWHGRGDPGRVVWARASGRHRVLTGGPSTGFEFSTIIQTGFTCLTSRIENGMTPNQQVSDYCQVH